MLPKIILGGFSSWCQLGDKSLPAILLLFLLSAGCGGENGFLNNMPPGIVPSDMLAPHLEMSCQSLDGPDRGDPEVRRDLERYVYIQQSLYDRNRRAAAADSFFALWRARPDHVLWPELEYRERRFLGADGRSAEILAQPVCADTSTAIGAYVLGWQLYSVGRYRAQFTIARSRARDLDPFQSLWIDLKVAYGERIAGDPDRSIAIASAALPRARELGGRRLEARVWEEIARAMLAAGELDDALLAVTLADTLTAAAIQPGDAIVGLLALRMLKAEILAARRETQAAMALYEANVQTAADLNLSYVASRNLNRAAMLSEAVGDWDRLLQYCQRGLSFALSDQDSLNVPRHMMNIAHYSRMKGELDSCLVYQKSASRWVAAYPDPANVSRMPLMQAEYYAQVGEYAVVDSLLRAAAAHAHNESTAEARAELHLELIRGWMETDRPDLIYRSIDAIEDLRYGSGDIAADRHVVADLNLLIGEFLTHRGEYILAAESLDMAAAALEHRTSPRRSWTLARNRGLLARDRGSLVAAEAAFQECVTRGVELGIPEYESTGRFLLGSVLLAGGRYAEARSTFPSTDVSIFVGRFTTRISALLLTGISYTAEGKFDLALETFAAARQACRPWSPPDLLARIDLEEGIAHAGAERVEEAIRLFDSVTARLVSDSVLAASAELAYFNGDLRRDLVEAVISLPAAAPASSLQLARNVLPGWRSAASAREDLTGGPQIIFFIGDQVSGRWTIDDDAVHWTTLPARQELNDMLAPVLADMAEPGRAVGKSNARKLAECLLDGVGDIWGPGQILAIVPDLSLFGVPWAALPLPAKSGALIDHGPLVILDMPTSEAEGRICHDPAGRLLVLGTNHDTVAQNAGLSDLHHAEREAHDVASAWPAGRSVLRVGAEASKALTANPDLASFEAIHVASHAMVFHGSSERTMLLLAGEDVEALTASRIRELDLSAEIVFLSCCEAADGYGKRSAYSGLSRSFLDAGARNVVAPLIVIDDEAARTLATRFYFHWLDGRPVPDALRAAQIDLRDGDARWAHPFYWAFYQAIASDVPTG